MGDTHKLKNINFKMDGIQANVDMGRIERNLNRAQFALDSQVMTDMVPYMPQQTGVFIDTTRAMSAAIAGSGKVVAAAPPMGRFLYEGKVMVDEATGSPWARKGAKKRVTDRDLVFSKPKARKHWFDAAKRDHGSDWVKMAKKEIGRD